MLLQLAVFGLATSSPSPLDFRITGSGHPIAGFAFGSSSFNKFVDDSYRINGGDPRSFYRWFNESFEKAAGTDKDDFLESNRARIRSLRGNAQVLAEMDLATSLHHIIRKMLPIFSLERGYEFAEAERHGKRQCLLQSVLISSLLQEAGLQSGVVMIFRRPNGETCNNAHNVALLRLSDGMDVLVDASELKPFTEHRGLLMQNVAGGCIYVNPIYGATQYGVISSYMAEATHAKLPVNQVAALDNAFIDSQFDYYRGERIEHGVFGCPPLPTHVKESAEFLKRSVQKCPYNPLPVYVLGRAYRLLGDKEGAEEQFRSAKRLYSEYGWLPDSVRSARA